MLNARARQRGLSLVELMIGLTVGLIVLSGILGLLSGHLRGNSELIRTTRLNNELRGTMDLVVRDLRRATYWGTSINGVWFASKPVVQPNPFLAVDTATAMGWRKPLLAWLGVALARAREAGEDAEVARLQRRIDLVAPPGR